ncbi:MAG: hypothetical protein L7V86_02645 [Verrucomicrobiales bacterium]|nr:hypothetical protein [Verrucomicrobiales bacterium]
MKIITTLLLLLATAAVGATKERPIATVHVFLKENCPIAIYHTKTLSELHERYAEEGIAFRGYVSTSKATEQSVAAFKAKFVIPFAIEPDASLSKAHHFGAKVTPEVIVLDRDGKTLYRGRIDNTYADLGKRRRVTTSHDLRDVLEALAKGEAVEPKSTEAVGCLIPIAKS